MKTNISIKNVSLGYETSRDRTVVMESLNLEIHEGELVGIVGLNGSGKSTLLKTLCGLLPALSGEIRLGNVNLSELTLSELAQKVAVVLTEKIGGFNLTAYDVVAAGQIPYTNSFHQLTEEHQAVIHWAISLCGLKQHQHKLTSELSDGLFQKTIIAKALAQQTPVLLLDEPSAFLDYASKHELFLLLKKLVMEEQKCVLVSSHDLDLLLTYCHKLLVVDDGKTELINVKDARNNPGFMKIGGGFI